LNVRAALPARYKPASDLGRDGRGASWRTLEPAGVPVIYAAGSLSLAMLERLVQRRNLGETMLVEAEADDGIPVEDLMDNPPSNWRTLGSPEAQAAGARWAANGHTALLRVPSALVPREPNYVINLAHPDTARIRPGKPEQLEWDPRLFGISAPRRKPSRRGPPAGR
jgi:RES domain-containing protein